MSRKAASLASLMALGAITAVWWGVLVRPLDGDLRRLGAGQEALGEQLASERPSEAQLSSHRKELDAVEQKLCEQLLTGGARMDPEEEIARLQDLATLSGVSRAKVTAAPIEVISFGCGSVDELRLSLTGEATLDQARVFLSKLGPADRLESVQMTAAPVGGRRLVLNVQVRRLRPH